MYLQVKKNWPILIQVKPTIAILNHSKPAIIFQSKDKELDIDHGGGEEEDDDDDDDENDYSVHNNRTIQLFLVARDRGVFDVAGWLDLTSTYGKAAEQRCGGGGGGGSDWILWIGIWFLCCYAFQRLFEDCWSVKRHMYA